MIKHSIKYYLIGVFLLSFAVQVNAQNNYELKYSVNDQPKFNKKSIDINTVFKDSLSLEKELTLLILKFQIIGFPEVEIDTIIREEKKVNVIINAGNQYKWGILNTDNNYWANLPNISYKSKDFDSKNFNYLELQNLFKEIITSLENTGYPFASVKLDHITIINNTINANLIINKRSLIRIDTIILSEFSKIKLSYIEQYLGINIGDAYNESRINEISEQLNRLEICQPFKPSEINFKDNKASIYLHLKEKKGNLFNGIIGFQPNSNNSNTLQLTGQINLKLTNAFQHGESVGIYWESLGNNSQKLKANFQYPYLLNSPFGIGYSIKLDKRDSSFLNINNRPSIQFALKGLNYLSVYGVFFQSNTLGSAENINPSTGLIDMHSNSFGFEILFNKLDYTFNPRKGFYIKANTDIGYKYYDERSDVNPIVYDSIPTKEIKLAAKVDFRIFIPIFRRQTLRVANSFAIIQSNNTMKNELYRIGGFKILRGFDEQSIFSSSYNVFSLEYRYLLDQNAYLGAFWDFGSVINTNNFNNLDIYNGFGFSFSFASKAGIFNLAYALGKTNNESILFKNSKIHFGYSALF